ncbi:hypothetical protein [Siphonobacter curvatus]|uniref:Uncharacterized protein n=1 Tax=Siphonobacter curvatus TaxID=2094562 RepID=A0A2S7IQ51_9BACT|nr:hypothetical protein [Siphonobacter curvatus]PQA59835.1 hypothetical protein C5O19_09495 [Siphonobacter curvatus]
MNNQPDVQGFVGWVDKNLSKYYFSKVEGGMLAIIKQFRMPDGLLKELQNRSFLVKEKIIRKGDSGWQLGNCWTTSLLMPAVIEVIIDGLLGTTQVTVAEEETHGEADLKANPFASIDLETDVNTSLRELALQKVSSDLIRAGVKPRERIVCLSDQNIESDDLLYMVMVAGIIQAATGFSMARSTAYTLMKMHDTNQATIYRKERSITLSELF